MTDSRILRHPLSRRAWNRFRRIRVLARRTLARAGLRNPAVAGGIALAGAAAAGILGWNTASPGRTGTSSASLVSIPALEATFTRTAERDPLPRHPSTERTLEQAWREAGAALHGRAALIRAVALMTAGCEALRAVPDYTATVIRQERVDGVLGDRQTISLKLRHQPLSLYLHWIDGGDQGREVLFVEGQNDGEMLVRPGGWKGRLLPPLKLNPEGSIARQFSRHSVTELGLAVIGRKLIADRLEVADGPPGYRFSIDESAEFDGRPALETVLEYDGPHVSDFYRKSIVWIDREWLVPVGMINYSWPEPELSAQADLDAETLVDDYEFRDVRLRPQLADRDFDPANESYRFRR